MGNKKQENRKESRSKPPQPERVRPELIEPGRPLPHLHRGPLLLMFFLLALLAFRQVGSMDAGFHLKAGNHILSGHGWPRTDPFTYTLGDHPYTDTSWGYQVLLALADRGGGAPGMVVFHLLILAGIFFLLYKTMRLAPVDPSTAVLLLGAGILACEMRYEVRPELLSYLFLAGLLYLLHRHALGSRTPLWLLPLLLWLWANCHALFVLGWVALACAAAGLWLRDRKPDRSLLAWGGTALLAPLLNPYGVKGVLFPFTLMTRSKRGTLSPSPSGSSSRRSRSTSPPSIPSTPTGPCGPSASWPYWPLRPLFRCWCGRDIGPFYCAWPSSPFRPR